MPSPTPSVNPPTPNVDASKAPSTSAPASNSAVTPANAAALVRVQFKAAPADSQPCNWDLKPVEGSDEQIIAVNNVSGSTFEGTRKEFAKALRGE